MNISVHYTDGSQGEFECERFESFGDVARIDGVLHTDVDSVLVTED